MSFDRVKHEEMLEMFRENGVDGADWSAEEVVESGEDTLARVLGHMLRRNGLEKNVLLGSIERRRARDRLRKE